MTNRDEINGPPATLSTNSLLEVLYRELFETERRKSGIYSNLWTILITGLGTLVGLWFKGTLVTIHTKHSGPLTILRPDAGSLIYLLIIPPLFFVWSAFAIYNSMYLRVVREYLSALEKRIWRDEEQQKLVWFSRPFKYLVAEGPANALLGLVVGITLSVSMLGVVAETIRELLKLFPNSNLHWIYLLVLIVISLLFTSGVFYFQNKIEWNIEEIIPGAESRHTKIQV